MADCPGKSKGRYVLEFGAFLPHALPEIILAISALLLALFYLKDIVPLYGSVTLIAIVYVITRISFATRAINSALLQIRKELEEAAYGKNISGQNIVAYSSSSSAADTDGCMDLVRDTCL